MCILIRKQLFNSNIHDILKKPYLFCMSQWPKNTKLYNCILIFKKNTVNNTNSSRYFHYYKMKSTIFNLFFK